MAEQLAPTNDPPLEQRPLPHDELILKLNSLEGEELERGLAEHYRSIADQHLAQGSSPEDIASALQGEQLILRLSDILNQPGGKGREPAPHADFLDKVDELKVRDTVMDQIKWPAANNEARRDFEAGRIKRELFSYQDVLQDPTQKQEALEYTHQSAAADNYAHTLAKEIVGGKGQYIEAAAGRIRTLFDETINKLPEEVRANLSPFASSESWIYWDMAKQKYLADHPAMTEEDRSARKKYWDYNPFEKDGEDFSSYARMSQSVIAYRYIGWEIHQMAQNGVNMDWLQRYPESVPFLIAATKEDGQLHSWQYAALGQVVADAAVRNQYRYP